MRILPRSIEKLINEFAKLPGIGPKSASRLTFYLYKLPDHVIEVFGESVKQLKTGVHSCKNCHNMSETEICSICSNTARNQNLVCVVEDPLDVLAIEHTGKFDGVYHVLGGTISPIDGIGPENLKIAELVSRVKMLKNNNNSVEIILAMNPSLEGDATVMYISKQLREIKVKLTKLARGIPVGGELEYTDESTLSDALNYRKEI
ncbi:MAG: recombination protein RecR [Candidatus Doudnabacteria bacterium CG10_big_fil_rev_8_21_14_0_10_41_10]|uniref:Recombination protein RecR n=1 Tax=Candidatus Doudnabacteria bacterium CG10_big_fil_rev_8_21_14_0_10_41_10 TaxID=1974551 RepID=A0A2H0VDK3_9BACT|nr:MAG: recombination protein RecR [Candidatus Doudnabacteria bacterium CG10_big_fil_rev_8_21_14_0_10_41_10]